VLSFFFLTPGPGLPWLMSLWAVRPHQIPPDRNPLEYPILSIWSQPTLLIQHTSWSGQLKQGPTNATSKKSVLVF
jgi:hypothetical protein